MSATVYVKFDRSYMVYDRKVNVGDVASVFCEDKKILARVRAVRLINIPDVKKGMYVFSVMGIIKRILAECPGIEINNVGESDFVIEYKKSPKINKLWQFMKIVITCLIVFVGSMFTIMAYNNDVAVPELFAKIYEWVSPGQNSGVLEASYCVGLTLGIAVFYNHFAGKKLSDKPTPIMVQMRSYEEDVDTAIIEQASRNKEEIDV